MGYKITKESYKQKSYVWDAQLEVLLCLFVKRLHEIRPEINPNIVATEILKKYVCKKPDATVSMTKIMREVYNNGF